MTCPFGIPGPCLEGIHTYCEGVETDSALSEPVRTWSEPMPWPRLVLELRPWSVVYSTLVEEFHLLSGGEFIDFIFTIKTGYSE